MVEVPAGFATLGIPRGKGLFGWDNEFEERQTEVPAFAIENEKVSSRRYLEFMNAGGYENPEFWEASDWQWRTANNIQCPVFWTRARRMPIPHHVQRDSSAPGVARVCYPC